MNVDYNTWFPIILIAAVTIAGLLIWAAEASKKIDEIFGTLFDFDDSEDDQ